MANVTPEDAQRAYLNLLLGGRKQAVLAEAMGVKRQAIGMILNGERKIMPEHMTRIATRWNIPASRMFADLAKIALNLEMGLPPGAGIGGPIVSAAVAPAPASPRRS